MDSAEPVGSLEPLSHTNEHDVRNGVATRKLRGRNFAQLHWLVDRSHIFAGLPTNSLAVTQSESIVKLSATGGQLGFEMVDAHLELADASVFGP
jgi:hypothetical protein